MLEQQRVEREAKQRRKEEARARAIQAVQDQGGLCQTAEEVDRLVAKHKSLNTKYTALTTQLRYYKVVLGKKSRLLVFSKKPVNEIRDNLVEFITTTAGLFDLLPPPLPPSTDPTPPVQKLGVLTTIKKNKTLLNLERKT